jgi:multicomponent Na+:H+ antiporter subunit G
MTLIGAFAAVLLLVGAFFFFAGTVGLLRLPDAHSRLHALTKADTVGLGFIVAGLILQSGSPLEAAKLIVVWMLALVASAAAAFLIAGTVDRREETADGAD